MGVVIGTVPAVGEFVEVRGRPWLVEGVLDQPAGMTTLRLSCVSDDAQGEPLTVLWDAEIAPRRLDADPWAAIAHNGTDDPTVFASFLRTLVWNTATAADRDLFQAPFRAGIRLDAYQLLPLQKALRLPRVNLLIADDVGLGKTVEAGLIVRELLLRRRIDLIVVAAPPSMTEQWRDELETKFGLAFQIIDREHLAAMRRARGFSVNPWTTGSRFIVSHRLLTDETYAAGLRDRLGDFRARALLILDEAHHAAPASGARYAIDSQFTKSIRDIANRFEHRLFLSATPHNGHSNSFSALLEMLDPQRFTRGVEARPTELEAVMVRRLKSDLRRLGEAFPERLVEPVVLDGLPADTPELVLARDLAAYGELRERRISGLSLAEAARTRLVFVGLQQRLLSSVAAFAKTLKVHRRSLERLRDRRSYPAASLAAAEAFARPPDPDDDESDTAAQEDGETALDKDEEAMAEAATLAGAAGLLPGSLEPEIAAVDAMLAVAERASTASDARVDRLVAEIRATMLDGKAWTERRLILFTEYEDTRRWLERRLREALSDTDRAEERIGVFSGLTSPLDREAIKRAFNADPAAEPIRILICTDAAREGINLQMRCADLVHVDLPWNPARLEQRNGRIDRKLQTAREVRCRYFRYAQRPEDRVLEALVRKTETIRRQLGSLGQVLEERVSRRLTEGGIARARVDALAEAIAGESDDAALAVARAEMSDEETVRTERLKREQDGLRKALEESRVRVGVDPRQLERAVAVSLEARGIELDASSTERIGGVPIVHLDPAAPAFAADASWGSVFDDLRIRPRKRGETLAEWRHRAPVRGISFAPAIVEGGRDAEGVVQVHLEHRLVRRLLSRFLAQGFQEELARACVIVGPGAQPRVVILGRLALYGPNAARLHEQIIPVTAVWTEADRTTKPLRPLGSRGDETTLAQLEDALDAPRRPPPAAIPRVRASMARDIADLLPEIERRAAEATTTTKRDLARRGEEQATSLEKLLEAQRRRIETKRQAFDREGPMIPGLFAEEERQKRADRRHWDRRLERLAEEIAIEPARVRASYEVRAERLEPVGVVYLWPASG